MHDKVIEDQQRILEQIQATFEFMPTDASAAEELRAWLIWQLRHFLDVVGPDDLSISEAMALVGTLGPAFSRTLNGGSGPTESRTLRAV